MSDATESPWGSDTDNPAGEGSETTAVAGGSVGERRAGEDPAAAPSRFGQGSTDDSPGMPSGL
jgi:hypothetical protein